jgi:RNA-splicing ligase RtcB
MKITGNDLIKWGYTPASWFKDALIDINGSFASGMMFDPRRVADEYYEANKPEPFLALQSPDDVPLYFNIDATSPDEIENRAKVRETMENLMKVPTIEGGAVMPDACPAGTIPVGGVVAARNAIHPGLHSADVCCSLAVANLGPNVDPKEVLDRASKIVHFGVGGRNKRDQHSPSPMIIRAMENNQFLQWNVEIAHSNFATQGDGNHFLYVGRMKSSGDVCVVTHHGSRGVGARLYKAGLQCAEDYRQKLCPETPKGAAWIPFDTKDGQQYWDALQIVGDWTRESHYKIHQLLGYDINDWFWNEHNYVFTRGDDLFYHAKGATPGWDAYDRTIVPLNMAEPILITKGRDAKNGLGFLPHGAGRNLSRTEHNRRMDVSHEGMSDADIISEFAPGIDVRFHFKKPDLSELPNAYKNAAQVREQIETYGLADVIDEIEPYGSIMAGEQDLPWKGHNKARRDARRERKEETRADRRVSKAHLKEDWK